MKIGIDCRTILNPGFGEKASLGNYTYELVKHLLQIDSKNQYILFCDKRIIETKPLEAKNVKIKFYPFAQYKTYLPLTYSQLLIAAFISREKLDLFHAPASAIPLGLKGNSIITLHSLALWRHPEYYPSKFLSRTILSTKILLPKSLEKADKIIAVSNFVKNELKELFGLSKAKIEVIYKGIDSERVGAGSRDFEICKKFDLEENYILYLGTIEPKRNVVGLIQAFEKLLSRIKMNRYVRLNHESKRIKKRKAFNLKDRKKDCNLPTYQLVLAGSKGWKCSGVFSEIERVNKKFQAEIVKYLGFVFHEDKIKLIRNACCFVFPPFYTGFGSPVLEAMSLGVPIIASNLPPIREIVGEKGKVLLINPEHPQEISRALEKLLSHLSLRKKMVNWGYERARDFSWEKCSQETLKVYEEVGKIKNDK